MMMTRMNSHRNKYLIFPLCGILVFLMSQLPSFGQPHPPRPMQVSHYQDINFGAFVQEGTYGTVIVYPNGSRSATGSILLVNMGYPVIPAIFEIEVLPGTVISLAFGPDATLTGSNSGTLTMHIGGSDPQSPFVTTANPPSRNQVRIGGTLTIGTTGHNPPGAYSGSFSVTFNQE